MSHRRIRIATAWTAVLLWMAGIFWFSSQTAGESSALSGGLIERVARVITPGFADLSAEEQAAVVDGWQTVVRKAGHMAEFALLGLLVWNALGFHLSGGWRRAGATAGIGLLYAVSDEVHQIFVPGRGPGAVDVLIDLAGVCVGIALAAAITHWRHAAK